MQDKVDESLLAASTFDDTHNNNNMLQMETFGMTLRACRHKKAAPNAGQVAVTVSQRMHQLYDKHLLPSKPTTTHDNSVVQAWALHVEN